MPLDYRRLATFLGHPSNGSIVGSDVLTLIRSGSFPAVAWDEHAYEWPTADILTWSGMVAPTVTALVPATATIGDPNFTLHVQGTGFTPGSVILWNGGREATVFVSATELTTGVNMATATTAVPIPVAVEVGEVLVTNSLTFNLLPLAVADPTGTGGDCAPAPSPAAKRR